MCRFFALRASAPLRVASSLVESPNALAIQSRRDARGQQHVDGWGLATYDAAGQPRVEKSLRPAYDDPRFAELAQSVAATSLVAHVRQASVGSVSLENTHPFVHGRWVFAHNGTLQNFAARRQQLLDGIPDDLRKQIRGQTDSEHAFYFWLGNWRAAAGGLDRPASVELVTSTLQRTLRLLEEWFPQDVAEQSKLNFIVTDGHLLAATRCRHMLSILELRTRGAEDRPPEAYGGFRAVLIASEPTAGDGWREVPDRSLVVVDQGFEVHAAALD